MTASCIYSTMCEHSAVPGEMGMLYFSEYRRRIGPMLWRFVAVMTEWVWERGVSGAVGVVGVWGRLRGGEASGADLDNVTLDTRLS